MSKRSLAVRPQCDDASRHAHFHAFGGKLHRRPLRELFLNSSRRVRPVKFVRIRSVAQGLYVAQLLAALMELVEGFKFQRENPFRGISERSFRRAERQYSGRFGEASRKPLVLPERWYNPRTLEPSGHQGRA